MPTAVPSAQPEPSRHEWLSHPLGVFVATRLLLLLFAWWSLRLVPFMGDRFFPESQSAPVLAAFCHYDCGHYFGISLHGYQRPDQVNWWPLYPLLSAGLRALTGLSPFLALLVTANLMSLIGYVAIYHLFTKLSDRRAASAGLLLFAAYPFAYYHSAIYAESTAMGFVALSLCLAARERWWTSSLAMGFAWVTRHVAIATGASLIAFHIEARGSPLRRRFWSPAVLSLFVPPLVLAVFLAYCHIRFGNALIYLQQRSDIHSIGVGTYWMERQWWSVRQVFSAEHWRSEPWLAMYLAVVMIPACGIAALASRRGWLALLPGAGLLLGIYLAIGMACLGRYSASLWPGFLPLGVWCARRPVANGLLLMTSAMLQGLFLHLWIHGYSIF